MSSEGLNENKERSVWNLFQKRNLRHPEIQEKGTYLSDRPTEIEKNPPNPVIRPLLVRPQARDEPAFLWRDRKKRILHTNVSNSNTLDYQSSTPTISNDYRNEEFNKWKQFIFAYAQVYFAS